MFLHPWCNEISPSQRQAQQILVCLKLLATCFFSTRCLHSRLVLWRSNKHLPERMATPCIEWVFSVSDTPLLPFFLQIRSRTCYRSYVMGWLCSCCIYTNLPLESIPQPHTIHWNHSCRSRFICAHEKLRIQRTIVTNILIN